MLFWCVPVGVFTGAVLEGISYFVPWYHVHYWAAGVLGASAGAAFLWSVFHYPSAHNAARLLDQTGLHERTMTALELAGDESFFAVLQKNDAWKQLSGIVVHKRLPIALTWKRPVLLGILCILFSVSCILPSPAKKEANNLHQVVEQAKAEIEKVEKVQDELKKDGLTDKELEEYNALVNDIKKELKAADSEKALEKALERAEKKLAQAADLKKAEDMKKAAETAEKLLKQLQEAEDLKELSEEEQEALKEALENLADLAENQELVESLQSAAAQIGSGSISSSVLASAQASVSAIKQAAGTVLASGEGQPHLGKGGQSGDGSGNGNSGNGSGSGSGNGTGSGSGSGSGNGGGWNYGSKNGKEKDISYNGEMVSVPNGTGDDENLTGRKNEGTSYVTEGGDSLTWSGNSVEYGQVIGEYSKQALSDIQSSDYPAGVQDIVKSYFEQLNQ